MRTQSWRAFRCRLLDNPKAAFRFISGLVIALFVANAAIGALSSIAAASSSGTGSAGKDTLADPFCSFSTSNCPASAQVPSVPGHALTELRTTPGARSVTLVHQSPSQAQLRNSFGIVACDQLARTPAIGKCAPGATVIGGLAASLAIIASTFPLLNRITGPEVARNE